VVDLLGAVVRAVELRRAPGPGQCDGAAHVGVVERPGRAVADVDQRRLEVDRRRVRERDRLDGALDAALGDGDGQFRPAAGPPRHLEGPFLDVADARVGQRFRDQFGPAALAGVAAQSVREFGQAGQQPPGFVGRPAPAQGACGVVVDSRRVHTPTRVAGDKNPGIASGL
jgi:hypothetical protein